jgi:hypothetical protein
MSTQPVVPAQGTSPGFNSFLNYFNKIAPIAVQSVVSVKQDLEAKDHVALVSDGMNAAAAGISVANPAWAADAQAANSIAQIFLPLMVALFHKARKQQPFTPDLKPAAPAPASPASSS